VLLSLSATLQDGPRFGAMNLMVPISIPGIKKTSKRDVISKTAMILQLLSSWSIDTTAGDSRVRNSQGTVNNVWVKDGMLTLRSQEQQVSK
jgi:hypothetical protein